MKLRNKCLKYEISGGSKIGNQQKPQTKILAMVRQWWCSIEILNL